MSASNRLWAVAAGAGILLVGALIGGLLAWNMSGLFEGSEAPGAGDAVPAAVGSADPAASARGEWAGRDVAGRSGRDASARGERRGRGERSHKKGGERRRERGDDGDDGDALHGRRAEVEARVQTLRRERLGELLHIEGAPAEAVFTRVERWDEQNRELQRQRYQALHGLRGALDAEGGAPAAYTEGVDAWLAADRARAESWDALIADLRQDLTAEQVARFILFQVEFERQLRRLVRAARNQGNPAVMERALQDLRAAGDPFAPGASRGGPGGGRGRPGPPDLEEDGEEP